MRVLMGIYQAEIGMLSRLDSLIFHNDDQYGSIPSHVGMLSSLGLLWLSQKQRARKLSTKDGDAFAPGELGSIPQQMRRQGPDRIWDHGKPG